MAQGTLTSRLLVATPLLVEPTFNRTVILLLEHGNDSGALGLVLNRPESAPVMDVVPSVADLATDPGVLFSGGPVSPSSAIALGIPSPGAEPDGWAVVAPPIVSVDLDHDPALLAASLRELRVYAGYAGWAPGQLENEIQENGWLHCDADADLIFGDDVEDKYDRALRKIGIDPGMLSNEAGHA